jgi:hypothetical protein
MRRKYENDQTAAFRSVPVPKTMRGDICYAATFAQSTCNTASLVMSSEGRPPAYWLPDIERINEVKDVHTIHV